MFYALAIVCDDYFVPSLEKISEVRKPTTPINVQDTGRRRHHVLPFITTLLLLLVDTFKI